MEVWLLCNVNKFPLDLGTNEALIQLGLCMTVHDFLHIGLWGCMDSLVVTKPPPKPLHMGLGYKEPETVQAQSYHMVLQFTVENIMAQAMWLEGISEPGSTTHTTHTSLTGAH